MILSTIFKPLQFIEKVARGINNVQIQLIAKSSNLGRFEEFFIAINYNLFIQVGREPQGVNFYTNNIMHYTICSFYCDTQSTILISPFFILWF